MYHTLGAAMTARKFLVSQSIVNKEDIGIFGISWGGVITSTIIGFVDFPAFTRHQVSRESINDDIRVQGKSKRCNVSLRLR
jgi:hypothetical protein